MKHSSEQDLTEDSQLPVFRPYESAPGTPRYGDHDALAEFADEPTAHPTAHPVAKAKAKVNKSSASRSDGRFGVARKLGKHKSRAHGPKGRDRSVASRAETVVQSVWNVDSTSGILRVEKQNPSQEVQGLVRNSG
jgi:hypothetical protein